MSTLKRIGLIMLAASSTAVLIFIVAFRSDILNWINHNEPLWLFCILFYEGAVGTATLWILVLEYFYDKEVIEEEKHHKRKTTKKKVRIEIDEDGNARIAEAPKSINVSIDHLGKQ